MITDQALSLARTIGEYLRMDHQLEPAECILVLGSFDDRVAVRGAELYLQHYAPLLIYSGGLGDVTQKMWHEPEADRFARIAEEMGVPKRDILIENKSTNTGENIIFTKKLLAEKNINPDSFILVQKPYMERRSYATFKVHWPDKKVSVTSPRLSLEEYPTTGIDMTYIIETMVGDLQRIKVYPAKGFQIPQEIPDDVWQAYEKLVAMGYDRRIIKE